MKEKGNERTRRGLFPKPIRELLMEVDPRGGPHRRLIRSSPGLETPGEANSDQYMHFMQLSAECIAQATLLLFFEESYTRLD